MIQVSELRRALSGEMVRLQPPPGLEDRVFERALARPEPAIWSRTSVRLLAGALMVILAAATVGVFLAAHQYAHRSVPVKTHPTALANTCTQGNALHMASDAVGWMGTFRTTDGGATFHDVTPPTQGGFISTCIFDANHAWAVEPNAPPGKGAQADHVVVYATADGGQTWQQGVPVPASGANLSAMLEFVDAQRGWLVTDSGDPTFVRTIYSTSDGGLHWTLLAALSSKLIPAGCAVDGMTFTTVDKGWMTWDCLNLQQQSPLPAVAPLAATSDGGRSWTPVALPALNSLQNGWACNATPPIFTREQGVLQVKCAGWTAVYGTADAGASWVVRLLPTYGQTDFLDASTGFYFAVPSSGNGSDLYSTTDGGGSWKQAGTRLFGDNTVDTFQFLDAETGIAYTSGAPWKTTDGGKTWSLLPPYRAVGNAVICPLASAQATASPVLSMKMFSPTTGWAIGPRHTVDGGASWANVGPGPVSDASSGYSDFFLDGNRGWVAQAAGSSTACADHVVISRTADGGNWQTVATLRLPPPNDANAVKTGDVTLELDFLDAANGWLLIETGGVFGYGKPGPLYRTADGGLHWSMVTAQAGAVTGCTASGRPVFSSVTTGWMRASCGSSQPGGPNPLKVLVTHDGGARWAAQLLVPDICCNASTPTFIDPKHGWIFVPGQPLLLVTSDGGTSWVSGGLPALAFFTCQGKGGESESCTNDSVAAVSFIDPGHGWAVTTRFVGLNTPLVVRVAQTSDGGRTWQALASLPVPSDNFDPAQVHLQFAFQQRLLGGWDRPLQDLRWRPHMDEAVRGVI